MHRIAPAILMGIAAALIALGQFRALPGHPTDRFDLREIIPGALTPCEEGRPCAAAASDMKRVVDLLDDSPLLLVITRIVVLLMHS